MTATGFPADDPVRVANKEALDAVATLGLRVESLKIPAEAPRADDKSR